MPQFRVKKSFGPSGLADVRVTAKGVRVVFAEGDTYELPAGATERASGKYVVSLSQDLTKILGMRPPKGTYIAHFKEFGNRANGIPDKKIQRGGPRQSKDGTKKWVQPDELVFTAALEIEDEGIYHGLTVSMNLPYSFAASPSGGTVEIYDSQRNLERLEEFFRACGFDLAQDIPFSPNVLPFLEHQMKGTEAPFMVTTTEKGFVDSIAPIPAGLLSKPKAKAKAKA